MSVLHVRFSPVAVGSGETTPVYTVAAGERAWCAASRIITPAAGGSTATVTLGDGDDADGLMTAANTAIAAAVGTIADGSGAYLAESGGKLYTARDTIDVVYAPGGGPGATAPLVEFAINITRDWPAG